MPAGAPRGQAVFNWSATTEFLLYFRGPAISPASAPAADRDAASDQYREKASRHGCQYLRTPLDHLQPRTFGYCRVSTTMQADSGISLAEQQHRISARCHEHSWALEHCYVDSAVSGSVPLGKRPQGGRLAQHAAPGRPDDRRAARPLLPLRGRCAERDRDIQRRRISLVLLDLGDCTGNGVSELILTALAAVAQFERTLISERIRDAKRNLRHGNRHQGGRRPFGLQYGAATGNGRARDLVPDEREQQAIADIVALRQAGRTLITIRDTMRARGHPICKQTVANIIERQQCELIAEAAE